MVGTIIAISLGVSLWAVVFAMLLYLVSTSEHWFIFMCVLMVFCDFSCYFGYLLATK